VTIKAVDAGIFAIMLDCGLVTNNPYAPPPTDDPFQPPDDPFAQAREEHGFYKMHRGPRLITFGVLGFVLCFAFGIAAWVMAASDLREMELGQMDPSGRGPTKAGKILGICSTFVGGLFQIAQIWAHLADM
jgi:hypothetical protein